MSNTVSYAIHTWLALGRFLSVTSAVFWGPGVASAVSLFGYELGIVLVGAPAARHSRPVLLAVPTVPKMQAKMFSGPYGGNPPGGLSFGILISGRGAKVSD